MRSSDDLLPKLANTTNAENKSEIISREVNTKSLSTNSNTSVTKETETAESTTIIAISTTEKMLDITTIFMDKEDNDINDNEQSESKLLPSPANKSSDSADSSTLVVSPTKSSEEIHIEDSESVTDDPSSKESIETTSHNVAHSVTVLFKPGLLESRSSVIEQSKKSEIETTTFTDINDFTITENSAITTVISQIHDKQVINSTPESRGDSIPNEESSTVINNLLVSPITEIENTNKSKNKLVEPPLSNLSQFNKTTVKNKDTIFDETKLPGNNVNIEDISAKNLPDDEDQNEPIHKIEHIVSSELQPASIKRKSRVPREFECRR